MTFKEKTYIFTCSVILVSQNKLEKQKFDRDFHIKTLIHLKTDMQVCEIQKRFAVQLLEYTFISKDVQREMTNSVQSSRNIMIKAISWQWYQRLEHCRSQIIHHLSKEWVINHSENDNKASKTIKFQTCCQNDDSETIKKKKNTFPKT
jgi:hypothetical protein